MNAMRWFAAMTVLSAVCALHSGRASAGDFCRKTADKAKNACHDGVNSGFWTTSGNCYNMSLREDRRNCLAEAEEELLSGHGECREQSRARRDICEDLGPETYEPVIDPARFLDAAAIAAAPNPYFPLVPGTILTYLGGDETITVTVTAEKKEILGVECVVVNDVVEESGEVIEDTDDWYAQDVDGNVWYMGEIARNFEDGELVDLEGSWKAGRDSAHPGILMPAPGSFGVGRVYRQEFLLGEAEDVAEVLSLTATAAAPAASCSGTCFMSEDYTPLEPDIVEHKFYAPFVGLILEIDPDTGEKVELVDIATP